MTLEDIGQGHNALLCITNLSACCRKPYGPAKGNWFFPDGTTVHSSNEQWNFHRNRGKMMVLMNRRRGGVDGIYRCEIPDSMNDTQTIYIGVYNISTGEFVNVQLLECIL